jgi:L-ornithine N5-oxygenase
MIHDILCVGFGPAGLALAIQLEKTNLNYQFIEKQQDFQWHSGMLLESSRMRISFLKDLVTLVDPTSRYTFVNFLHETNSLVEFINLDTCTPYRIQYNEYLKWVSNQLESHCAFGEEVVAIEPVHVDGQVELLKVISKKRNGHLITRTTRNLVVSAGHKPNVPKVFENVKNVYHSSQYLHESLKGEVVVIGSGQSAAELVLDLSRSTKVKMIFRDLHLRTVETSPFVNQVFDPSQTDFFYQRDLQAKQKILERARVTNYSVIEPELLKELYGILYRQKYQKDDRIELVPSSIVCNVVERDGRLALKLENLLTHEEFEIITDNVVLATGYTQNHYAQLLSSVLSYLVPVKGQKIHKIGRDYRLETIDSFKARIYLQGYCEETHGISDTLLSVCSIRAKEIVQAVLDSDQNRVPGESLELARTRSESEATLQDMDDFWIPKKAAPGTLLYTKYIESLQMTISLEVASVEKHIDYFHEWMNNPRVDKFWKEAGKKEDHIKYLEKMTASLSTLPVIGTFNGEPFGYFEVYWAYADPIGKVYPSEQFDRGIHFVVGNEKYRGPHRVQAWLNALCEFILADDPRTTRIVSEPRSDNDKMIAYLLGHGFKKHGLVQFPHKEAMIVIKSQ